MKAFQFIKHGKANSLAQKQKHFIFGKIIFRVKVQAIWLLYTSKFLFNFQIKRNRTQANRTLCYGKANIAMYFFRNVKTRPKSL